MGRDELKSAAEPGGFVEYGKEQLPKIDSMRRDKSQPDFYGIPILHDADVMFTRASEMGNKPASCYTCQAQQSDLTCFYLGPRVSVAKVVGHRDSGDPIEYWPCCGFHNYGPRREGKPVYADSLSNPDTLGLIWINSPKLGQQYGGANCGGVENGDDCDHYLVKSGEKWDNPTGYCRVLAHEVGAGDVCTAWRDDDELSWEEARQLMDGASIDTVSKKRIVRDIMKKE
jgi:hypothetical protein